MDWRKDKTVGVDRDLRKLSIRHLAIAADGQVAFGCQYEGDPGDMPYLTGIAGADGKLSFLPMPDADLAGLRNYVGSVALDESGTYLAASSPHGGRLAFWNIETRDFIGTRQLTGVCGIAAIEDAKDFLVSSGSGGVRLIELGGSDTSLPMLTSWSWDNHLRRINRNLS